MEVESESCRLRHSLDAPCLQAVYKGCTRDAHRMYQLKTHGPPMSIPCTPLVHGLGVGYVQGIWVMAADAGRGRNDELEGRMSCKLLKNSWL